MGESFVIDSTLGGGAMARAYSADMRQRVIDRVESGASRREAAEHYEVSPSTAVIWVKCFRETGRCAAKPRGGSTSPLEKHADFLLALIELEPDLTLDEVVGVMRELKILGSRTAVWRFFQRHKITFKKKPARGGAGAPGRSAGTPTLDARTLVIRCEGMRVCKSLVVSLFIRRNTSEIRCRKFDRESHWHRFGTADFSCGTDK